MAQIQVQSGAFDLDIPRITLGDMAHALSMICRYYGNCDVFWSVGNHIILCKELAPLFKLPKELMLPLLLHDGAESYIGDVNGKFKKELTGWYLDHEVLIEKAIAKKFGFEYDALNHPLIKTIDEAALYVESKALFMSRPAELWSYIDNKYDKMEELKPFIRMVVEARNSLPSFIEVELEFKRLVLEEIAS